MKLTFKKILTWYDIYILQSTEEEVIEKLKYDKDGKERTLPKPDRIRSMVIEKVRERCDISVFERIKKKFDYSEIGGMNGEE